MKGDRILLACGALLAAAAVSMVSAAQVGWRRVETQHRPSAREMHAMAYDAARGRVVLYGGDGEGDPPVDTWEYDGTDWYDVTPSGPSPGVRTWFAMAYDASRGRVVLFGGDHDDASTWEWDGASWTQITPAAVWPEARAWNAMTWDATRQRVLTFAGCCTGADGYNDLWEWDGATWALIASMGTAPPELSYHRIAYDTARSRVVVFGGTISVTPTDQLWEWDSATLAWAEVPKEGEWPPDRMGHALAFDEAHGKTVVFGGTYESNPDDTWEWDGVAGRWSHVPVSGEPSPRHQTAMVYDSRRGVLVLFGGSLGTALDDTWEYPAQVSADAQEDGGCGCRAAGRPAEHGLVALALIASGVAAHRRARRRR